MVDVDCEDGRGHMSHSGTASGRDETTGRGRFGLRADSDGGDGPNEEGGWESSPLELQQLSQGDKDPGSWLKGRGTIVAVCRSESWACGVGDGDSSCGGPLGSGSANAELLLLAEVGSVMIDRVTD